jgi:soluble lytic murein transglycosylase-like protein
MLGQVDDILARKAPGLGLAVRGQLSRALVEESNAAHLDPLLTLAVMRVESEFDDDATSVRGARGLMQIKPTTLAFIAHQQGIRLPTEEILRDPVLSTRLAVRYLGRLNQAFHGDLDAALMAYNAGPHRISSARAEHDADRFLIYPRNVRRAWRRLRALPPSDDQTVAERDMSRR